MKEGWQKSLISTPDKSISRSQKLLELSMKKNKKARPIEDGSLPDAKIKDVTCNSDSPQVKSHHMSTNSPEHEFTFSRSPSPEVHSAPAKSISRKIELPKNSVSSRALNKSSAMSLTPKSSLKTETKFCPNSFYSTSTPAAKQSRSSLEKRQDVSTKRKPMSSVRRHRSRSLGGARKRKRVGSHVGHGIKKPRLRQSLESGKKSVTNYNNESNEKSTIVTGSSKSSVATSKTGQLNLSAHTKVQFEVKGGNFVYRAKAKAGLLSDNTPLRRSPRKLSPLKANYFTPKGRNKGKGGKLFSPNSDYLQPDLISPSKSLPSPVKIDTSVDTVEIADLSNLITSLAKDQAKELVVKNENINLEPDSSTLFDSREESANDVSSAIHNILNDLSSEAEEGVINDVSECSEQSSTREDQNSTESSKLFPIFNKITANSGNFSVRQGKSSGYSKKFVCNSLGDNQTVIDAGQKEFGPTHCGVCGTVYTVGDPEDELYHSSQHSGLMEKLRYPVWKTERVVGQFPNGSVLCVRPGDHSSHWRKVEEVLSIVDRDLGFSEVGIRWPDKTKVYMFVAEKKIVGFLLAEAVSSGYKILPKKDTDSEKTYYCSDVANPVRCGISRIWVLSDYRRKKVASILVDCMRSSFIEYYYLKTNEFAFSDPTLSGIHFASKYMQSSEFLVYNR